MAQELIKVLKDIHRELIVANMETPRLKEMQREVFKLEDQYKAFEQRAEAIERRINEWVESNGQDCENIDALVNEKIPDMVAAEKRLDKKLTQIYEDLETYKGYGLVMEYE